MAAVTSPATQSRAGESNAPALAEQWPPRSTRRRCVRRVFTAAGVGCLVVVLAGVTLNLSVSSRMERIDGAFEGMAERPAPSVGETILLVGTWPGNSADVPWLEGEQMVESMMLVEIAEDRTQVRVESLPLREGVGASAVAAQPSALVSSVEAWSDRRVDHLMAIDWQTFARLAADNGVDLTYQQGSPASLQLEYLQEVLKDTLEQELRKQPLDLFQTLATTADGTAVDDQWSILELDLLVFSLRNLRSRHIEFAAVEPGRAHQY